MSPIATAILIFAVVISGYMLATAFAYHLQTVERNELEQVADLIAEEVVYQLTQSISVAFKREAVGSYNVTLDLPREVKLPPATYRLLLRPEGRSIVVTVVMEGYPNVIASRRIYSSAIPKDVEIVGLDCLEGAVDLLEGDCTILSKRPRFVVRKTP